MCRKVCFCFGQCISTARSPVGDNYCILQQTINVYIVSFALPRDECRPQIREAVWDQREHALFLLSGSTVSGTRFPSRGFSPGAAQSPKEKEIHHKWHGKLYKPTVVSRSSGDACSTSVADPVSSVGLWLEFELLRLPLILDVLSVSGILARLNGGSLPFTMNVHVAALYVSLSNSVRSALNIFIFDSDEYILSQTLSWEHTNFSCQFTFLSLLWNRKHQMDPLSDQMPSLSRFSSWSSALGCLWPKWFKFKSGRLIHLHSSCLHDTMHPIFPINWKTSL